MCADLFMSMQPQYWLPSFLVQEYLWATGLCWPALPLAPSWFTGTQREALIHYKSHGLGWVFTKFYCQIAPPKMVLTQKYWKSLLQRNQMFLIYSVLLYQYALIQTSTVGLKLVIVNLLNLWVSCTLEPFSSTSVCVQYELIMHWILKKNNFAVSSINRHLQSITWCS